MNKGKYGIAVLAAFLVLSFANAQGMEGDEPVSEDTTPSEISEEPATTETEVVLDEEVDADSEEMTTEYEGEEVEIIDSDLVEEVLVGEVIEVDDEFVYIATTDDEIIAVPTDSRLRNKSNGRARQSMIYKGQWLALVPADAVVVSGTVTAVSGNDLTIKTQDGVTSTYTIPNGAKVHVEGKGEVEVSEIEEGEDLVIVTSAEGEVIGVELDSNKGMNSIWYWAIGLVVIILGWKFIGRKKRM